MMFPHLTAVHINGGMHHHSVKLQPYQILFPSPGNHHISGIIAGIPRIITGIVLCWCLLRHIKVNHSIMWEIHKFSRIPLQHAHRIQHSSSETPFFI